MEQLDLPLFPVSECGHNWICQTCACVPSGIACLECGALLAQYIPLPPSQAGYLTADWAWKHVHGLEYS